MGFPASGWGAGKWGAMRWGYAATGVMATATRITDAMIAILEQNPAALVQIAARMEIDGTDVTEYVESFQVTLRANAASNASFRLLKSTLSINLHQSVVVLLIDYTAPDGSTFTAERFRGLAHQIEEDRSATGSAWSLTCYGLDYRMQESAPKTYSYSGTFFAGSALDGINEELLAAGFGPAFGDFEDYTTTLFPRYSYGTGRDYVNGLANYLKPTLTYCGPDGIMRLKQYDYSAAGPWSFPLAAQTEQAPVDDSTDRTNRVWVFPHSLGHVYNPWQYWTVQNTSDQASRGVLFRSVKPVRLMSQAQAIQHGTDLIAQSQLARYSWRSMLHAFVAPLEVVTLTLPSGSAAAVMVEEVTDSGGFPAGYWSSWRGRAVP